MFNTTAPDWSCLDPDGSWTPPNDLASLDNGAVGCNRCEDP